MKKIRKRDREISARKCDEMPLGNGYNSIFGPIACFCGIVAFGETERWLCFDLRMCRLDESLFFLCKLNIFGVVINFKSVVGSLQAYRFIF